MTDVSVMLPVFDAMPYLPSAIESILEQDFSGSRELLVVNDGSHDGSAEWLDRLGRRIGPWRIQVFHQANQGLGVTRSRLLDAASGRYLFAPDADDWIPAGTIESFLDEFSRSKAGFIYSDHRRMDAGGKPGQRIRKASLHPKFRELIYHNFFCGHLKAYDAHRIQGFAFEPGLRSAQDYEFILRILPHVEVAHIPIVGCHFRFHPKSHYARTPEQARESARNSVQRHLSERRLYGDLPFTVERIPVEGGSFFQHFVAGGPRLCGDNERLLRAFLRQSSLQAAGWCRFAFKGGRRNVRASACSQVPPSDSCDAAVAGR